VLRGRNGVLECMDEDEGRNGEDDNFIGNDNK